MSIDVASPLERMGGPESGAYRAAAARAPHLWPGVIGELIQRELLAADTFHYLPDPTALPARLLDAVRAADH